ncbi:putative polygalacturonase [Sesamum angolense]|uniref:Polygalacturonase n=1 Tax=Sesamum angolense TaxID=2727404 RepID=A0AAE1WLJ8_9LAMI|nr:putative polygalacturonase [Sesamum angolense]
MRFSRCNNIEIRGVVYKNSQKNHVSISECNNATVSGLHMIAPPKSPNTDGIDISSSTNIHIYNCTMETGDDCIAINGGTSYVTISEVVCGPGHGISIGSLGANGKYEEVEAINVSNCTFNGSTNGVRIKTWQVNIYLTSSVADTKATAASAVQVSDVTYIGLRGTSISKNATVSFRCSDTVPCTNIILDDVNIRSFDPNTSTTAVCINAHGTARSTASPIVDCLLK